MTGGAQPDVVAAQLIDAAQLALRNDSTGTAFRIVGIGWATVELDRAAADLGASLGLPAGAWLPAPRDALLGAAARLGPRLDPDGPRLILLEPDTEGRLAASLVRLGESVAAVYVARAGPTSAAQDSAISDANTGAGLTLSRMEAGPLGPARLIVGGPVWGPHIVVVDLDPARDVRTSGTDGFESVPSGGD